MKVDELINYWIEKKRNRYKEYVMIYLSGILACFFGSLIVLDNTQNLPSNLDFIYNSFKLSATILMSLIIMISIWGIGYFWVYKEIK
jgi:hypothetical protein